MKKTLFLFLFSIVFYSASAQMVVNDPGMLAATTENWAAQLEQASKQYGEIKEQSKILQETIDQYKLVNNAIKTSKKVKSLIDRQVQILSLFSSELSASHNPLNANAYASYKRRMTTLLDVSKENIESLTDVLTDSKLKLTDYERLKLIDDIDQRSYKLMLAAEREKKQYHNLNSKLEQIEILKSK